MAEENETQEEQVQETEQPESTEPSPEERQNAYLEALPPDWRDKSPDEIKSMFGTMQQVLSYQGEELKRLRESQSTGAPAHAREEPEEEEIDYSQAIFDDPEKVIASVVRKHFGQNFEALQGQANTAVWLDVRQRHADFGKYEERVRERVRQSGVHPSQLNSAMLEYAYYAEKGMDAEQAERRRSQSGPKTEKPTPEPKKGDKKSDYEFENELEAEIFENSGMELEEYLALKDKDPLEIMSTEG